jgi:hypothetical protein
MRFKQGLRDIESAPYTPQMFFDLVMNRPQIATLVCCGPDKETR